MKLYHDSHSQLYRIPAGAAPCGTTVTLRLCAEGAKKAWLRIWWNDAETLVPMTEAEPDLYEAKLTIPDEPGVLWYYFRAEDESGCVACFGNAADGLGGIGMMSENEPASYQLTVYDGKAHSPEWLRDGVMMQIMVDRFRSSWKKDHRQLPPGGFYHARWDEDPILVADDRSGDYQANDFFGGDLKGIEEKLDYLADLGVTVLYLNPIFQASSNHKYNTGDYHTIDPSFGTEADFVSLCESAKQKGIRVILDGVFSHTGSDSVYFNKNGNFGPGGAYQDENSPYSSWYRFDHWPEKYDCWWGFKTLPNVNEMEPDYREFVYGGEDSVIAHWLRSGASGWRLDVADELPMAFLRELRAREKEVHPDSALIGEVWEDPTNKVAYGEVRCYCLGDTLDSTMNYPLRDAVLGFFTHKINAHEFVRRVEFMQESQPKPFFYSEMNLLGSHDKPRTLSVLAEVGELEPERYLRHAFDLSDEAYQKGRRRLILAWRLVCALPGMPCVYYGDEAGLYGMTDPFCRGTYPWGREDQGLIAAFRDAIQMRKASPALRTGEMKLSAQGGDVVIVERSIVDADAFGRSFDDERRVLVVNRSDEERVAHWNGETIILAPESATWLE